MSERALLVAGVTVSGVVLLVDGSSMAQVSAILVLALTATVAARGDLFHPFSWYVPVFSLYAISMPLLVMLVGLELGGETLPITRLHWIALATFISLIGPRRYAPPSNPADRGTGSAAVLLVASTLVTVPYLSAVVRGGFASKLEILTASSPAFRLTPAFSIQAFVFAIVASGLSRQRSGWWGLVIAVVGWTSIAFLITGERDYVLRILWIALFVYNAFVRRLPVSWLVTAAVCGFLAIPILGDLKNALIVDQAQVTTKNILIRMLADEFITSGRNLQVLIDHQQWWQPFGGETLWWDVKRTIVPDALFPGAAGPTPTNWFNEMFYPSLVLQGGGVGFTMIGEGYMNFGTVGVGAWFAAVALFVKWLYRRWSRSMENAAVYIVTMPVLLYVIRADMAGLMSQFLKHIVLPLLCMKLIVAAASRSRFRFQRPIVSPV